MTQWASLGSKRFQELVVESCVEYWEAQCIDPFEAITAVGCKSEPAISTGHDGLGGFTFFALVVLGLWLTSREQESEPGRDIFR